MRKLSSCKEIKCPLRPKGKRSCDDDVLVCHPKNAKGMS